MNDIDKTISATPLTKDWTHVTFVLENTTSFMYLNGDQIKSAHNGLLTAPKKIERKINFIGKDSHNSSLYMAEATYENLKIYKGALTPNEVKKEYLKYGKEILQ